MDVFALFVACLVWWRYSRRAKRLEASLAELRLQLASKDEILQELTRRVYRLETGGLAPVPLPPLEGGSESATSVSATSAAVEGSPEPSFDQLPVAPPTLIGYDERGVPIYAETNQSQSLPPPYSPAGGATLEAALAAAALPDASQPVPQDELQPPPEPQPPKPPRDWEALIGTSLLNAVGVLVLVIGISLLLGYTLTVMGPAGKVAIGAGIGLAMIAAGIVVERRDRFVIFGRGLIAGGWAALYFTAYAMHALPAARIITSPVAGATILIGVAAGMIAHSLRYRSQTLTLLAFFTAYLALILAPVTLLTVVASVPLTIALLVISRALDWTNVPVAGMLLTYFSFAFRYDASSFGVVAGAGTLYTYWVCYELYDLLRVRSGAVRGYIDGAIFPLNILLLFGVASMTLPSTTPIAASDFLASVGILMTVSTALRMRWYQEPDSRDPVARAIAMSYRLGIAVSAGLFAAAILKRFDGYRAEIGLLLEAQLLIFAGLRFGDRFFWRVGHAVFGTAIGHVLFVHNLAGKRPWDFMLIGMAVQAYANRWLTRIDPQLTWAATTLLAIGVADLVPERWFGVAWLLITVALVELWLRLQMSEFRYQAIVLGSLAVLGSLLLGFDASAAHRNTIIAVESAGALLAYGMSVRLQNRDELLRTGASWGGTLMAAWAIWLALPAPIVAVGWGLLSLLLLDRGILTASRSLRTQAHLVFLAAAIRIFFANLPVTTHTGFLSHRLLTVAPLIVLALWAWRRTPERFVSIAYSWAATLLTIALLRFELGRTVSVLGWATLMLVLWWLHSRRGISELRMQAYLVAMLTFARAWATNFYSPDLSLSARLALGLSVIAIFHGAQFLTNRDDRSRSAFALAGSMLLALILFHESSGRLLTISWGIQAVVTLGAGFATQERILRLTGLSLFLVCILKLFLYDLRELDTLGRILSFIGLGIVLIGASWLYMRFKNQIQRYL